MIERIRPSQAPAVQTPGPEIMCASAGVTPVEAESDSQPEAEQAECPAPAGESANLRRFEESLSGQVMATGLRRIRYEQDIPDPQQAAAPATPATQPSPPALDLSTLPSPPTSQNLADYFTHRAPHANMIAAGRFREAAAAYHRDTAVRENANSIGNLMAIERQLNFADRMQSAIQAARHGRPGEPVRFPPTEQNVAEYFRTLRNRPPGDVVRELREYNTAFYAHHGSANGEMSYDPETHRVGRDTWPTAAPEDWADINDSRQVRPDGRRLIDCEGFAYLGERLLREAGFTSGRYVALRRADNPDTTQNESEVGHIVYAAQRNGSVVVVSNHQVELSDSRSAAFGGDLAAAREATLQRAIRGLGQLDGRGEASTAWRADYELNH